jgi:hypothetical protein
MVCVVFYTHNPKSRLAAWMAAQKEMYEFCQQHSIPKILQQILTGSYYHQRKIQIQGSAIPYCKA